MSATAAWFVYSVVISNLFALAAVAGETALRDSNWQGRWVWAGALVLSVAFPLLAWLGLSLRSVAAVPTAVVIPLAPLMVGGVTERGWAPGVDNLLIGVWVLSTVVLGGYLAVSWLAIRRRRSVWREDVVEGVPVLVTRETGPAVWGIGRPRILLPEWALGLEARIRRLMLLHEGEHVRSGDTRLVLLGQVILVSMPWNLPLWWQYRRLRQAVEMDCDMRVLRLAPHAREYGAVLLEVGRRRSAPVLGVALAEPVSFLERRIRAITAKARRVQARRVVGLASLALVLGGSAVCTRDPVVDSAAATDENLQVRERIDPSGETRPPGARELYQEPYRVELPEPEREKDAMQEPGLSEKPTFTPFTIPPRLLNAEAVREALENRYPPLLRDAGIGGTVEVWFFIDETGRIAKTLVNRESGYPALDEAALRVADVMEFSPALNRDRAVPVWVQIPMRFSAR